MSLTPPWSSAALAAELGLAPSFTSGDVGNKIGRATYSSSDVAAFNPYTPPSAVASNYNVYNDFVGIGTLTQTSDVVGITVSNGQAPFTYSWWQVSGDAMTIASPNASSTYFSGLTSPGMTRSAVFNCEVDDARGSKCWIGNVTVTLEHEAPGSGGDCCWVEATVASGKRIGDLVVGDELTLMHEDGSGCYPYHVTATRAAFEDCATIVTEAGVTLTCSYSTPIPHRTDPSGPVQFVTLNPDLVGSWVPVSDAGRFGWDRVKAVTPRGPLPVQRLSCDSGVYAAGDQPGRLIFTHNSVKQ